MSTTHLLRLISIVILLGMAGVALVQYSSTSWPRTTGMVETGNWAGRDEIVFGSRYKVRYSYEVNGKVYSGYRIGFASKTHVVPVIGAKDPRQPREGDMVQVYYVPFFPRYALLVPGPSVTLVWWCLVAVLVSILLWSFSHVAKEPVF